MLDLNLKFNDNPSTLWTVQYISDKFAFLRFLISLHYVTVYIINTNTWYYYLEPKFNTIMIVYV